MIRCAQIMTIHCHFYKHLACQFFMCETCRCNEQRYHVVNNWILIIQILLYCIRKNI